jgi:hypothetical protein
MRINREILLKIARDTVAQETRAQRDILSAYLIGSLLEDEPLLGGTTDIDLVYVWNSAPPGERTIQLLSEQVHLDIAHHSRTLYRQARRLRQHPWLGQDIARATILFDPQHFMDFAQASVRGLFDRPENTLERAQRLAEKSRQTWLAYAPNPPDPQPEVIHIYLSALENAGNALASLGGAPLAERRFLLRFQQRAEALQRPGLYNGLLGLLGGTEVPLQVLQSWLPDWRAAFALPGAPPVVAPERLSYYQQAVEAHLVGSNPQAAWWPLLRSWTRLAEASPAGSETRAGWQAAFSRLGLLGDNFVHRLAALDAYLDQLEETLEAWGRARGVW